MLVSATLFFEVDDKYNEFDWSKIFFAQTGSLIDKARDEIVKEICNRLNTIDFTACDKLDLPQGYITSIAIIGEGEDEGSEDVIAEW